MRTPKSRLAIATLALCLSVPLVGCVSDQIEGPPRTTHADLNDAKALPRVRTLRDEFRNIALRFPGFAGLWLDDQQHLVVSFAGDNVPPGLPVAITAWLNAFGRSELAAQVARVHKVDYDYNELYGYLEEIKEFAVTSSNVTFLGIDDMSGRLLIGLHDEAVAPLIQRELIRRGIPANAVNLEVTGSLVEAQTHLTSTFPDMMGGIQINRNSGSSGACSIGFVGFKQMTGMLWPYADFSQVVFTTAAHCTSNEVQVGGNVFGQPDVSRPVGVEIDVAEIYLQGSSYCSGYPRCRLADVAVVQVNDGISSWPTRAAKSTATLSIFTAPYLGWQNYTGSGLKGVITGDLVTKVGRTSGQTSGQVAAGCLDILSSTTPGLYTLCAARAPLSARGGDSGAPVFIQSTQVIGGLLFARSTINSDSYFSRIEHVEPALGYRYVFAF